MRKFGLVLAIAGMMVTTAAYAQATAATDYAKPASTPKPERVLYVCDRTEETQRSFQRTFGEVKYITAREALSASRRDDVWTTPRCISDREYQKMMAMVADQSRTIRLSSR